MTVKKAGILTIPAFLFRGLGFQFALQNLSRFYPYSTLKNLAFERII
jgi:hypothetical protein